MQQAGSGTGGGTGAAPGSGAATGDRESWFSGPVYEAGLQAFFVVLGVILALVANEWASARADKAQAQVALQGILDELEANHQAMAASARYHQKLIGELRELEAQGVESAPIRVFSQGFVSPADPLSVAWDTARATDVLSHLEYRDVLLLSRIYASQERYEDQSEIVGAEVYRRLFADGRQGILEDYQNLAVVVGTFLFRERQLTKEYRQALAELGREVQALSTGEDAGDSTSPDSAPAPPPPSGS